VDGCPAWLAALMRTRDYLLQPFLAGVARRGEVCVVFVNGELLHVVHKDPGGWGAAEEGAEGAEGARHAAINAGADEPGPGEPAPRAQPAPPAAAPPAAAPPAPAPAQHPSARQCVRLLRPPPAHLVATARRALALVAARCGGPPYLARVDLLPSLDGGEGGWLVSELELGWPELFLRADRAAVPHVARALLPHLPPEALTPRLRAALEADAAASDSSEPRHGTVSLKRARLEPG
jgi:hypothetical protein